MIRVHSSSARHRSGDLSPATLLTAGALQDLIPTSLLKLTGENTTRAVKMFAGTLKYMGETTEDISHETAIEVAQKLLHQAIKRPDLKDELYMHLIKQTRGNPNIDTKLRAWELFFLVASTIPPSKLFIGLVSEYIHNIANDDTENDELQRKADLSWRALKRSAKAGARHTLPSFEEIDAAIRGQSLQTIVFFLDETFEDLHYDITTTVQEAVEQLASVIKLHNYTTFTLFECRKVADPNRAGAESLVEEHVLLDDHKYIADVLYEIRSLRGGKEAYSSRLLFKKRMFRETDEAITETQFVNLSYVQAQYDYLQGNYPVVRDDASQVCALQIQAEVGPTLVDQEDAVLTCIEKCAPSLPPYCDTSPLRCVCCGALVHLFAHCWLIVCVYSLGCLGACSSGCSSGPGGSVASRVTRTRLDL